MELMATKGSSGYACNPGAPMDIHIYWWNQNSENYFKLFQIISKKTLASNADLGAAVVLSMPRSAFLADFQLAGACSRPNGGNLEKAKKTKHAV